MADKTVTYQIDGDIATITLNRPEKLNAMHLQMCWDLNDVLQELEEKPVRVAILTGSGDRAFSTGLDLSPENTLMLILADESKIAVQQNFYPLVRKIQAIYNKLETLPFPVIASVHGYCFGIALELALAADFRICADDAVFTIPEVSLGMIPDIGGCPRLAAAVGPGMARELIYTGAEIDAAEALRIGLVNHVHPKDELAAKTGELAQTIADQPPLGVTHAKRAINRYVNQGLDDVLDYCAQAVVMCIPSEDVMEAFMARMEKRKATFKGR